MFALRWSGAGELAGGARFCLLLVRRVVVSAQLARVSAARVVNTASLERRIGNVNTGKKDLLDKRTQELRRWKLTLVCEFVHIAQ